MPPTVRRIAVALVAVVAAAVGSSVATARADAVADPTITCDKVTLAVPRYVTYSGKVTCRSSDGSPIDGYTLDGDPTSGDLVLNQLTGAFTYTPNQDAEADGFWFLAHGAGQDGGGIVVFDIKNFAPACPTGATAATPHDRALKLTPACTDANKDAITLTAGTKPAHGTLTVAGTTLTYTPARGYVGRDTLTYRAGDGEMTTEPVTVAVSVVNAAPRCTAAPVSVVHDRPRLVTVTCKDADGDRMTVGSSAARHGSVSRTGPTQFRFTPARHFVGTGSFAVTARDGVSTGVATTVRVRVTNHAPRLAAPARISARGSKTFRVRTSDRDRDPVRIAIASRPRHGTVSVVGTAVTYRPRAGYRGRDSFSLRASDGIARSARDRVAVAVTRR
ncbi:Ig-like domain-containing protein [Jatrophihabitans fulvus]